MRRRDVLAGVGTAAALGLAGCAGDDSDETTNQAGGNGNTDGQQGEARRDTYRVTVRALPGELGWAPWNVPRPYRPRLFSSERAGFTDAFSEHHMHAFESTEFDQDSNTYRMNLRDDLVKHDGSALTANDLYTFEEMLRLQDPEGDVREAIRAVDDTTLEYVYPSSQNKRILDGQNAWRDTFFMRVEDVWIDYLERLQDASTDSKRKEITNEILEYAPSTQDVIDNEWGTGPFKVVSAGEQTLSLELNEDHWNADNINISRIEATQATDAALSQLKTNGELDSPEFSASLFDAMPDYIDIITRYAQLWNMKLLLNYEHPDLADRNVRRAMAAVVNTEDVVTNVGEEKAGPVNIQAGMNSGSVERFLGDMTEDFINYSPRSADYEKAESYLARSGYTRENGTIYREDGSEMEPIELVLEESEAWFIPGRTAGRQLEEFGFPIEVTTTSRTQKRTRVFGNKERDYDMVCESHYAGYVGHPYRFFRVDHYYGYELNDREKDDRAATREVQGWIDEGRDVSPWSNRPLLLEAPVYPDAVGERSLDGVETFEHNFAEVAMEIESGVSDERLRELMRRNAWVWNFNVPDILLHENFAVELGNTRDWQWPSAEKMKNSAPSDTIALVKGLVDKRYE
jgi:ABC-type transport system substrate-binding protein